MIERTSRGQNSRILLYGGIKEMMRNREVLNEIKKTEPDSDRRKAR